MLASFHCHQENATGVQTACRGWASTARNSIAMRLAVLGGVIDINDVPEDPESDYYGSGAEACAAGLRDIKDVGEEGQEMISRLLAKGAGMADIAEDETRGE